MGNYKPGTVLEALVEFEQREITAGLNYLVIQDQAEGYLFVELKTYGWVEVHGLKSPYAPSRWDYFSNVDNLSNYKKVGHITTPENKHPFTSNERWLIQPGVKEFYHNPEDLKLLKDYLKYLDDLVKK